MGAIVGLATGVSCIEGCWGEGVGKVERGLSKGPAVPADLKGIRRGGGGGKVVVVDRCA
jgi:hypothetical protein